MVRFFFHQYAIRLSGPDASTPIEPGYKKGVGGEFLQKYFQSQTRNMKKTLSLTALLLVITVCAGNDVESEFTLFLNSANKSFLKSKPFEICVYIRLGK